MTFLVLVLFGLMVQWQPVAAQDLPYNTEDMTTLKQFFMSHPGLLKLWCTSLPSERPDDTNADDPLWDAQPKGWHTKCGMTWIVDEQKNENTIQRISISSTKTNLEKVTLSGFKNLLTIKFEGFKALKELVLDDLPALTAINLKSAEVESLTCTDLPALKNIDATKSSLKSFTHSNLSALEVLLVQETQLESLDLSDLSTLTTLETYVAYNLATIILPEMNSALKRIYAGHHPNLTELKNLEKQTKLTYLYVINTGIFSLDASMLKVLTNLIYWNSDPVNEVKFPNSLEVLRLGETLQTEINMSGLSKLHQFTISGPNLKALDLSNNTNLTYLAVNNTPCLTRLDLSTHSGTRLATVDVDNNPNLEELVLPIQTITNLSCKNNPKLSKLKLPSMDNPKKYSAFDCTNNSLPFNFIPQFLDKETDKLKYTGQTITIRIPEGIPTIDMAELGLYDATNATEYRISPSKIVETLESEFTVPADWKEGDVYTFAMWRSNTLPDFKNKPLILKVEVGKAYKVYYNAVNGTMDVSHKGEAIASGSNVMDQEELELTVTPDTDHLLALFAVNNRPMEGIEANQPFNLTVENNIRAFALSTTDGAPADNSGKGIVAWDMENATIEAKVDGTAINNGALLASGTVVDFTIAPAQDMGIEEIQLNEEELDVTEWSFSVRIPEAENKVVPPTILWVKGSADGWKAGDPDPGAEKYTLTYEAIDGGIAVAQGVLIYPSGSSVRKGTELSVTVTPDNTKELALAAINGVARTDVEANKPFDLTIEGDTRIFALCTTAGTAADGSGKGILAWDQEHATVVAAADGTVVANGALLAAGTIVEITVSPAPDMGMEFIRLNGEELDVTTWSFSIRIPDEENNKVAPTFLWVKGSVDGWEAGDSEPVVEVERYKLTHDVEYGSLMVYSGSLVCPSGMQTTRGTLLRGLVTPDDGYVVTAVALNDMALGAVSSFETTMDGDLEILALCMPDGEDTDGKGRIYWNLHDATLTAQVGGQEIENGILLDPGTVVNVTVVPDDSEHGILELQVNGDDQDKTVWNFTVTIPEADGAGKIADTFIWASFGVGGWKPGNSEPELTYHTLEILETPEAITINPSAGKHLVEEGYPVTLRLAVDERYDEKYVFLRLDEEFVLVKKPAAPLDFSYMLPGITQDMEVEVIVSNTENPDGSSPVSNDRINNETIRVWSSNNQLWIETPRPMPVEIYAVNGRVVARRTVNGTERFSVDAGIYFIKAEKTVVKVAVSR
ncbi:leucine-rich repeat domain-containing protein [Parabacteroides sp. PF5-6]|uniref:leucine-rich repeat domain-containing protein n=1 Tax=Parabacteroides sp. PF5-6 TaxID=1742403 RepID=UPI0024065A14|nr:leucine-rich repeat domain-containing protein [Parabacteroides sp. PF5-6]